MFWGKTKKTRAEQLSKSVLSLNFHGVQVLPTNPVSAADNPWMINGLSYMGDRWIIDYPWIIHGQSMDNPWLIHG